MALMVMAAVLDILLEVKVDEVIFSPDSPAEGFRTCAERHRRAAEAGHFLFLRSLLNVSPARLIILVFQSHI